MDSPLSWTDQHPPDCKAVANERHLSSLMSFHTFCFYFHFFCSLSPSLWNFSRTHGTLLKFHIKLVVTHSDKKVIFSLSYRNIFCTAYGALFTASYSCTGQCAKSSPKGDCRLRRELLWKRNRFTFLFSLLVKPHLEKRPCMRGLMLSL